MRDFYARYERDIAAARTTAGAAAGPGRRRRAAGRAVARRRDAGLARPLRACLAAPVRRLRRRGRRPRGRRTGGGRRPGVLERLRAAPVEEARAVGLGREHRIAGNGVAGAAPRPATSSTRTLGSTPLKATRRRWLSSRRGIDPGAPGERYQVVVHVDAAVLADADQPGQSVLEGGAHVPAGTSQRLACDAGRVVMQHGRHGRLVEV